MTTLHGLLCYLTFLISPGSVRTLLAFGENDLNDTDCTYTHMCQTKIPAIQLSLCTPRRKTRVLHTIHIYDNGALLVYMQGL